MKYSWVQTSSLFLEQPNYQCLYFLVLFSWQLKSAWLYEHEYNLRIIIIVKKPKHFYWSCDVMRLPSLLSDYLRYAAKLETGSRRMEPWRTLGVKGLDSVKRLIRDDIKTRLWNLRQGYSSMTRWHVEVRREAEGALDSCTFIKRKHTRAWHARRKLSHIFIPEAAVGVDK